MSAPLPYMAPTNADLQAARFDTLTLLAAVARIERKVDILLRALDCEGEETVELTLDGEPGGAERDQSQSLG